jgi:hypothetical protein
MRTTKSPRGLAKCAKIPKTETWLFFQNKNLISKKHFEAKNKSTCFFEKRYLSITTNQ